MKVRMLYNSKMLKKDRFRAKKTIRQLKKEKRLKRKRPHLKKTNLPVLAASTSTCPYTGSSAMAFAVVTGSVAVDTAPGAVSTVALPRRKPCAAVPGSFCAASTDLEQRGLGIRVPKPTLFSGNLQFSCVLI